MKYLFLPLFFFLTQVVFAQDDSFSMRAGYSYPYAPYGVYSEDVTSAYANNDFNFYRGYGYGITFDAELPSKYPFMKYRIGAFYSYADRYDGYEDDSQISEAWLYLTGFGIYSGLSFRAGWDHFGITSMFALGFYTYDYRAELQYTSKLGVVPISDNIGESVSGPGGKFELGLYGSWKSINIYPSFQFLNTARGSQSLLIKSFNLSLGYTFKY